MTIDDLCERIRSVSDDAEIHRLADLLVEWKSNSQTADALVDTIEHVIGNVWIGKAENHRKVFSLWSAFKEKAISGIGGMAMNERLYWFSLFDEYDACQDPASRLRIYKKVMAKP